MKDIQIGIIAEGSSDFAVIRNILRAIGFESHQIKPLRPALRTDATDSKSGNEKEQGGWQKVKQDCITQEPFYEHLQYIPDSYIVVHLDSAETKEYGVERPDSGKSNPLYFSLLRKALINKINEWLQNKYSDRLFYAIAIEEIDAWVLTIYEDTDSTLYTKPKEELNALFFGTKRMVKKGEKYIDNPYYIRGKLIITITFPDHFTRKPKTEILWQNV